MVGSTTAASGGLEKRSSGCWTRYWSRGSSWATRMARDGSPRLFFFQAEYGIRDSSVTGVQTCALPIFDDDRDVVLVALVEHDRLVEHAHAVIDLDPREAVCAELVEQLAVLALAPAHDRREHHEARALGQLHDLVDDLLRRLADDRPAADRAVRLAHARPQQAQVVVDLGDGTDGRARVARGRRLVDRDRRRKALDRVDIGLVHLPEELARVGRQRLDVAALALGVDRVERQARLARSRQARDDYERVARKGERDV